MLFGSVELARRIEGAEARLSAELATTIRTRRPDADAVQFAIPGGVAVYTGPSSPINKLIGAGFDELPSDRALDEIEAAFAERDAVLQAEVSTLAMPDVFTQLSGRGYVLSGFENVLGLHVSSAVPDRPDTTHTVVSSPDEELERWTAALIDGFEFPDVQGVQPEDLPPRAVLESILGDMSSAPSLQRYAIEARGRIVAGAGMRIDAGVAQFTGSSTHPEFRRRGMQSAFIQARLAAAAAAGCDVAVVTTAPGSKSQQNLQTLGFTLLYSRALLLRHPA